MNSNSMRFDAGRARHARRLRAALAACRLATGGCLVSGCALVHNYDDPDGPRFEGHYSSDTDHDATEFVVGTFNIQFAEHIHEAIEEIERSPELSAAEVLLLQEMDNAGADAIAQHFGFEYVYYPGSRSHGKDFGNAVLSLWPIADDQKLILPYRNPSNGRIRIAVMAMLDTPAGELVVYSVHSETPWLGPRARLEQAKLIANDAAEFEGPTLVGGDFNTIEGDAVEATVDVFEDRGYRWATSRIHDTTTSLVGSFTLDHIFVRELEPLGARTQSSNASDHQPVWVTLRRDESP